MDHQRLYYLWLKYVGVPALVIFIFGLVSAPLRDAIFSPETAQEVLLQAIPFVSIFITIILLFMLLIAFVAIRLHKRISYRTHKAIELTLVAGILICLFSMFQSVNMVGYSYGFLFLLSCLLSFILWTHVTPRAISADDSLPSASQRDLTIGLVAGFVTVVMVLSILYSTGQPQAPFGLRQRQWDSYDEDRQTVIQDQAMSEFQTIQIPYFVVISLIPGAIIFFVARELTTPKVGGQAQTIS
jgi:lysylphosphatidylglycerol synthetase-like protein (DUF2156 family)